MIPPRISRNHAYAWAAGLHARSARETPTLLPHALPNHGGSGRWACASI